MHPNYPYIHISVKRLFLFTFRWHITIAYYSSSQQIQYNDTERFYILINESSNYNRKMQLSTENLKSRIDKLPNSYTDDYNNSLTRIKYTWILWNFITAGCYLIHYLFSLISCALQCIILILCVICGSLNNKINFFQLHFIL